MTRPQPIPVMQWIEANEPTAFDPRCHRMSSVRALVLIGMALALLVLKIDGWLG